MSEFEMESKADIVARLQTNLKDIQNKQSVVEGTFNSDMLTANAIEFEQAYAEMSMIVEAAFARTSWGDYLTMIAEEYGVIRKAATKAIGEVHVTGRARAPVVKGSLFATEDGTNFYTSEEAILDADGAADIPIVAETAGAGGNVEQGTIVNIPMSIPGVESVINKAATHEGFEEETDAELLERYLLKVRTPATSGNTYHYRQWALSVEGVGQCKVLPLWNGNGTVKVIILDSNNATASTDTIKRVADYIEAQRPVGATVTVTSPTPKIINVEANIVGSADTAALKKGIDTYFKAGGFELKKVTMGQIGRLLMELGTVEDYENLTLNGAQKSVVIGQDELAACGEVILHVVEE